MFERQETPWPKTNGESVLDILVRTVGGQEERWVATGQSGVHRLRAGRWTAFRPANARGQWRVVKLLQQVDAQGRAWLWATTNQGLARFDGAQWTLFGHDAGLPDTNLIGLNLMRDSRGRPILWMGSTSAGIVRVDVGDPRRPVVLADSLPTPPDPSSYGALRDSAGRIYVCTNNGVQQLTPRDGGYATRVFNRHGGMVHDECNTNAQFIDAHDRFWTGTLGGLTVYDPRRETRDTQAKPLRLTGLHVDGERIVPDAADGGAPGELRVAAGARTVDIEFALLSWYQEDESRFRTQLLGFEEAAGEWTAQASRSFNSLPPGSYLLRVEARDHAGNASEPIELPISVEAQWWQRTWARAVATLALLLLAYAAVQWRMRALKARQRVLEGRVAKRTAELDAANARLVDLSYRDALTGLANRRRLREHMDRATGAGPSAGPTALVLIDVDHFKAYNDRFGHPAGDEALRQVAATLLDCAPADALVARYGGEEFACLLPGVRTTAAAAIAERMRVAVAACVIPVPGDESTMRVTISAGVASRPLATADDAHRLLRDADLALYEAKGAGRNRVCRHDGTPADACRDRPRGDAAGDC